MGEHRNGARTFLNLLRKACKMSHMDGFQGGLNTILGPGLASDIYSFWTPLCSAVEAIAALDNFFNQKDTADDDSAGEDTTPGI